MYEHEKEAQKALRPEFEKLFTSEDKINANDSSSLPISTV